MKGYWNHGYDTTRNQVCCSRQNDRMRKIDVSVAHCQKLCSGKDLVAQLKFGMIMILEIRLGMTRRIIKLVSNENYLRVIESECEIDSLIGVLE